MARAMTTKAVESIRPDPVKRREVPDPSLSGLYLIIQPSGAKSWALRYRYGGKPRKLTLGKWPVMGVAAARLAASEAVEAIEHGKDPGAEKKMAKAARLQAQLAERDKVKTLVSLFAKRHLSKLKSGAEVKRRLEVEVLPVWGNRDIQDIHRRDVIDLLDSIADSGRFTTANRVRAYLSKFFNWCVERDLLEMSPAMNVKAVAKEKSRERVLTDDELRWFWLACDDLGQPWGPLGKFLLLTGQRLGEVVAMTDDEIDGDKWHLKANRTKNSRAHDVPLSPSALAVMERIDRIGSLPGYIHTTTGTGPLGGFYKGRNRIADRMAQIAESETGALVNVPHWTWHDLRRTCATGLARLGTPVRVTEAVLNHVSGSGSGIVAVYQRHDFADEKRAALDAWARFIVQLVEGNSDSMINSAKD